MTLQNFRDILLTVTDNVYHFEAYKETDAEYIVWQETGGNSLHGSNERVERVKKIQVELYTAKEFTETLDKLTEVLEKNEIAFSEPLPDFDNETKRIRYIIGCEVI